MPLLPVAQSLWSRLERRGWAGPHDLNERDDTMGYGHTPLMESVWGQEHDADPINRPDPELARLLLEAGADVHAPDNEGCNVFWYVGYGVPLSLMGLLLEHGANLCHLNDEGQSALHAFMTTSSWQPDTAEDTQSLFDLFLEAGYRRGEGMIPDEKEAFDGLEEAWNIAMARFEKAGLGSTLPFASILPRPSRL